MAFLEASLTLPKEGIFVIVGICVLVALYAVLSLVKSKKKKEQLPGVIETPPEPEKKEEKESEAFRPVVFVRTNCRTIGEREEKKEENNDSEQTNS
ncbi:MAG: hypothetical protein ACI3XI_01105 [Eubacteriales bacterium]